MAQKKSVMSRRGVFITFEGGEGGGKSTQIRRAAAHLRRRGISVLILREPGGTKISEAIRSVLLDKHHREMTPEAELLLYLAARAQIVREKILPALTQGITVIVDRFEDSTLAYQGFGRGLSLSVIEFVSRGIVRGSLRPDVTFLFDLAPEKGFSRIGRRDRMEQESLAFHGRVRRGFLKLAQKEPSRFHVMDASLDREALAKKIREVLDRVVR